MTLSDDAGRDVEPANIDHTLRVMKVLRLSSSLELALKLYIATCYAIVKLSVNETIPFNFSYKDVENSPLEKLLSTFKKFNGDSELHKRLDKIKASRNYAAHQGLSHSFDAVAVTLGIDIDAKQNELVQAAADIDACLSDLGPLLQTVFDKLNALKGDRTDV